MIDPRTVQPEPAPRNWFARHTLFTYLALAFGISWIGFLLVADNFPVESEDEFRRLIAPLVVVMLLGPSLAGLVATWLKGGRPAFQLGLMRMRLRGLSAAELSIALFTAPIVIILALLMLSQSDPWFRTGLFMAPRPGTHLLLGLLTGAAAGFFEEIGWTGYLTPALRRSFTPTTTGVLLGVIWGLWHLVASYWGSLGAGDVSIALYLPVVLFSTLVPYRLMMTWMYERTQSIPLAMLMHGALTASLRILEPIGMSGWRLISFSTATSALFCLLAVSFVAWRSIASGRPPTAPSSRESFTGPGGF